MTGQNQRDVEDLLKQAIYAFSVHDYTESEHLLMKAIQLQPKSIESRYHLANLYQMQNLFKDATLTLEPIKEDHRIQADYAWNHLQWKWSEADYEPALESASFLFNLSDLPQDKLKALLDFSVETGDLQLYQKICQRVGNQAECDDAIWVGRLSKLLSWIPNSWWKRTLQVRLDELKRQGRWRRYYIALLSALMVDRYDTEWRVLLADYYRLTRDIYNPKFTRERSCYVAALKQSPNQISATKGLILTLNDMCLWAELDHITQTYLPTLPTEWSQRIPAMCASNLEQYDKADQLYRTIEESHDAEFARFFRGLIALESDRYDDAEALFTRDNSIRNLLVLNQYFSCITLEIQSGFFEKEGGQKVLDALHDTRPNEFTHDPNLSENVSGNACCLCGFTEDRKPLWRDTHSGWIRVRCPECSMISVAPIPDIEDIEKLYQQPEGAEKALYLEAIKGVEQVLGASETNTRNLTDFQSLISWGDDFKWDEFEHQCGPEKRSLDIGCSAGKTVAMFQQCGWDAMGIDLDADAVAFAQSKGLNVKQGFIEEQFLGKELFDFISLVDVIEHVADPSVLLQKTFDLLKPNGLLYVKTPCADSLPHHFVGDAWLESCEHLHFFSRETLLSILASNGFDAIGVKQPCENITPYLHPHLWKQHFYPRLLETWISKTSCGDTIMGLARKKSAVE